MTCAWTYCKACFFLLLYTESDVTWQLFWEYQPRASYWFPNRHAPKHYECHASRIAISSTFIIGFTTIAPDGVCFRHTDCASATPSMFFDIFQMLCVKVCYLSHLLTTITEATLCTMPCLLLECRLIVPFLISAQPNVGLSSLDTQVSAQNQSIIRFLPISSIHCILSFSS